ncbi:MAG: TadE family protein [Candidatus Dormiibacterota bacterium]
MPRDGRRGQAMVEFSLITPVIFFVVFGIFEFGMLTFDLASSRFATSEAAKVVAQVGSLSPSCSIVKGCPARFGAALLPPNDGCDADCQMLIAVNNTALGSTSLEQVDEIDLWKLKSDGTFAKLSPAVVQKYKMNSLTPLGGSNYPASGRNTQLGTADFVQVDIVWTYNPLTGLFKNIVGAPQLTTSYIVRLEPQRY